MNHPVNEIEIYNDVWHNEGDCSKSDLWCLHNEDSLALATEEGVVILFHTGIFTCTDYNRWYQQV